MQPFWRVVLKHGGTAVGSVGCFVAAFKLASAPAAQLEGPTLQSLQIHSHLIPESLKLPFDTWRRHSRLWCELIRSVKSSKNDAVL